MRFVLVVLGLSACGSSSSGGDGIDAAAGDANAMPDGAMVNLTLPSVNAKFDYQVGGAYAPPSGVTVVARARGMTPASGLYNICHVNGFQIAADDESYWV